MAYTNEISYDKLVEKALKNVVVEALKIARDQGLPGEHHYYITFKTTNPKTEIPAHLKSQYPREMTIILQHQFYSLQIEADYFSVELSFSGKLQKLKVAYDSITYFGDPYAKFGLTFSVDSSEEATILDEIDFQDDEVQQEVKKVSNSKASVVDIAAFRKKK